MNLIMAGGVASNRPVIEPKPKPLHTPAWSEVVILKDRYVAYKGFADLLASRGSDVAAINRALMGVVRAKKEMDEIYFRWGRGV